jgi:hypothetical protein
MWARKSILAKKPDRVSAAAFGMLLGVSAHATAAVGVDPADALPAGAPLYGYFREARGGASVPARRTASLDEIRRGSDNPPQVSWGGNVAQPTGLTAGATVRIREQAAEYRPIAGSAFGLGPAVDASLSDLLARLQSAFGGDLGFSGDRVRQDERGVLLTNPNAFVRAKVRLTLGKEWLGFLYADMGATDSALRWQGLVGIRGGHGVDLLGGWRHVTYHFSPGTGFDSLDFNGPFLGATLAW